MDGVLEEIRGTLEGACARRSADAIALSGGLDSTIVAWLQRGDGPAAVAVAASDFVSTDLTYCQMAARHAGLDLEMLAPGTPEVLDGIEETIRILGNFNDIEIRNSVVAYIAARWARDAGYGSLCTGDGADELFGGYDFMVNMDPGRLGPELERVRSVMHFPSHEIGRALGVRVESPFLDPEVEGLASRIPPGMKVREEGGRRHGKWVLRKAFEDVIPRQVAWRPKSPMQDGAGTAGLTGLFDSLVGDEEYAEKKAAVERSDGVVIRSKESMHYYETYRRIHGAPRRAGADPCPYCGHGKAGSRFCRMCGAFPV